MQSRYLIYLFKNRTVRANIPKKFGGYKINGKVKRVFRNIMDNQIEINVGTNKYVFKEPSNIVELPNKDICFVYGKPEQKQATDEQLFTELQTISHSGGNINDAIENTKLPEVKTIKFRIQ